MIWQSEASSPLRFPEDQARSLQLSRPWRHSFGLAQTRVRANPRLLFVGALLTVLGVVFNRVNVVLLAMSLKGPMPQIAPETYSPSIFEWGISVGLIAATIFLFGLGVRLMPVLPREQFGQGD